MILNNADNIMCGSNEVDRVFCGNVKVWERGTQPDIPAEVQQQITEMQQQFYPETPLSEFGFIYGVQYNQNNPYYLTVLVYPKTVEPFLWAGASSRNTVDFSNNSSYTKRAVASGSVYTQIMNMHYLWDNITPDGALERVSVYGNFPQCRTEDGEYFGVDYYYIGTGDSNAD